MSKVELSESLATAARTRKVLITKEGIITGT